ncbi:pyroglutamyl-peptidase I (PGP) [Trypanosoma conorhini]|uniref:Pyroglutamyl-peptidase I (PGP) n=1 Tax=Trypanosoma conorhini TaxID=83891 RepID=A0A422PXW8_9TRYP|nr:pyroglutamyl-peptidase I (PGP) [Trypanosoma conorhini]RNF22580.1 pyroglutamyl-peptidase I (PGP) [Trypanosoma conorhini]
MCCSSFNCNLPKKRQMKHSKLQLYMTGFGPFKAITVNPSAAIGEAAAKEMVKDKELQVHYEELEVTYDAVSAYFKRLEEDIAKHMEEDPEVCVLIVHVGLHSREQEGQMRLEVRAYNELEGSPIEELLPLDTYVESVFGCERNAMSKTAAELIEQLNAVILKQGHEDGGRQRPHWLTSRDAGRYYCNYTLYKSVHLQKKWKDRVFPVFVHVANAYTCNNPSLEEQTAQVHSLVSGLVRIVRNKDTNS